MKYTLGEKLGFFPSKENEQTTVKPSRRCLCGRGFLEYEEIAPGEVISRYNVWDGGKDFGRLSYVPCCSLCEQEQEKAEADELDENRRY